MNRNNQYFNDENNLNNYNYQNKNNRNSDFSDPRSGNFASDNLDYSQDTDFLEKFNSIKNKKNQNNNEQNQVKRFDFDNTSRQSERNSNVRGTKTLHSDNAKRGNYNYSEYSKKAYEDSYNSKQINQNYNYNNNYDYNTDNDFADKFNKIKQMKSQQKNQNVQTSYNDNYKYNSSTNFNNEKVISTNTLKQQNSESSFERDNSSNLNIYSDEISNDSYRANDMNVNTNKVAASINNTYNNINKNEIYEYQNAGSGLDSSDISNSQKVEYKNVDNYKISENDDNLNIYNNSTNNLSAFSSDNYYDSSDLYNNTNYNYNDAPQFDKTGKSTDSYSYNEYKQDYQNEYQSGSDFNNSYDNNSYRTNNSKGASYSKGNHYNDYPIKKSSINKKIGNDNFDKNSDGNWFEKFIRRNFPCKGDSIKQKVLKIIFWILIIVVVVCLAMIGNRLYTDYRTEKDNSEIQSMFHEDNNSSETTDKKTDKKTMLSSFNELFQANNEIVGWLKIDNSNINYPVMQTDDNSYYLSNDFYKKESKTGALFADFRCDIFENRSDNVVIYGHNTKQGNFFSQLGKYKKLDFVKQNPLIHFTNLYKKEEFKVIACFLTNINASQDNGVLFDYHNRINFNNEKEFKDFYDNCKKRSYYVIKDDVKFGDELLTLSTCSTEFWDARFVVVARKLRDGESSDINTDSITINSNQYMPKVYHDVYD